MLRRALRHNTRSPQPLPRPGLAYYTASLRFSHTESTFWAGCVLWTWYLRGAETGESVTRPRWGEGRAQPPLGSALDDDEVGGEVDPESQGGGRTDHLQVPRPEHLLHCGGRGVRRGGNPCECVGEDSWHVPWPQTQDPHYVKAVRVQQRNVPSPAPANILPTSLANSLDTLFLLDGTFSVES